MQISVYILELLLIYRINIINYDISYTNRKRSLVQFVLWHSSALALV